MSYETIRLDCQDTGSGQEGKIAWLTLNRPETANAFDASMLKDLSDVFRLLETEESCRALVIRGEGKHFSGGADLNWMKASAGLSHEENLREARKMSEMFERLYRLPFPTTALIHGAAYGGATGLTACCDIAIADKKARFCLSEVRLGILPAVILPYLSLKMRYSSLQRLSMTARPFSGKDARKAGLVEICCDQSEFSEVLKEELNGILGAGPLALKRLKSLQQSVSSRLMECQTLACETIADVRSGAEASEGFSAFFAKKSPSWVSKVETLAELN